MELFRSSVAGHTVITVEYEAGEIRFLKYVVSSDLSLELGSQFMVKGPVDLERYQGWDDLNTIAEDLENRGNRVVWLANWISSSFHQQA